MFIEKSKGFIKHRGPIKALGFGIGGKILGGYDAERGEFPFQVSWQSITRGVGTGEARASPEIRAFTIEKF